MDGLGFGRFLWVLIWFAASAVAHAAGPVETNVFAVQGVAVDETDKDAVSARNKALVSVQVKALNMLANRLASPEVAAEIAKMEEKDVVRLLRSLSIEEESTAPGRFIGKFTVRFQPAAMRRLFGKYGVSVIEDQAEPMLVLPIWKSPEGAQLWEDNPWKKAWIGLNAQQAIVPLIVPIGDLEDTEIITAQDVLNQDAVKIEALRRRYDVKTILVATAEPSPEGGVRATMSGESQLGRIVFDKTYQAEDGTIDASAALAAERFHGVMTEKYKQIRSKQIAAARAEKEAQTSRALPVAVPFSSPSEWNAIRARILSAPGVLGVDVSTLGGNGAVIQLIFTGPVESMQVSLQRTGLNLGQVGGTWVIQPM
ncbi:MAG: DUF2066 domain-containing protein [Aestuariivirga sp.]